MCQPREGHLPRDGAERIGSRSLPLFREHRTERPTERSELQPERPPEFAMAKGVAVPKIGPDEHNHSGDSDGQPDLAAARDVMVAEQQGIERQKPERRDRNQQRRQAGGNDPLRVGKREVAAHQKQNADRRQMAKLSRRKSNAASGQRTVSEHNRARDQKTRRAHNGRRNMLHCDADAEISRSPEDIDQPEGNNDLPSTRGRSAHGSGRRNSEYQSERKKSGHRAIERGARRPTTSPSRPGSCWPP